METWSREVLYREVWEQPASKVAIKYGVSGVMIGKICRKLQIPLPGRGYWAKKEFGKPVERVPLPEVKDLPVLLRHDFPAGEQADARGSDEQEQQTPEPTDEYHKAILEMESRSLSVSGDAKRHKLASIAAKTLNRGKPNHYGILERTWGHERCLDIRVTKTSLDRAVNIANAIIHALESEKFKVSMNENTDTVMALIFGQEVPFTIVEKVRETGRRQVKEYSWTRTVIDYEGSGTLEFRADGGYGRKIRDRKNEKLESMIALCVGAMMREARSEILRAEQRERDEIERQKKAREMAKLREQIEEEEKKVKQLQTWVDNWARARLMREFIAELEKVWANEKHDLSQDAPKGKRIAWMKEQADRVDPMVESPPSILDRKR